MSTRLPKAAAHSRAAVVSRPAEEPPKAPSTSAGAGTDLAWIQRHRAYRGIDRMETCWEVTVERSDGRRAWTYGKTAEEAARRARDLIEGRNTEP